MQGLRRLRPACASTGIALALLIGCKVDGSDYSFGFGGSSGATGSSGRYDSGVRSTSFCDNVTEGEDCPSPASDACERGSSANYACNAHLRCDQTTWQLEPAQRENCRTDCPTAYTETFGGCAGSNPGSLLCEYDQGTCGCAPVVDPTDAGAPEDAGSADAEAPTDAGDAGKPDAGGRPKATRFEWRCMKPKASRPGADAGSLVCPRLRPREGEECVRPMTCDYGACVFEDGYRMACYGGSWVRDLSRSTQCDR